MQYLHSQILSFFYGIYFFLMKDLFWKKKKSSNASTEDLKRLSFNLQITAYLYFVGHLFLK